jgi:hypothetical protein
MEISMRNASLVAAVLFSFAIASHAAMAEEACTGTGPQLPKTAVEAKLKAQGYVTIKEIKEHNGCYEAKGLDKNGKRFELEINSYSGEISNAEQ